MANRENYPASLFPLQGDISAQSGQTVVTVTGIQGIPVTAVNPTDGQTLVYDAAGNIINWGAASSNNNVQINGVGVSYDKHFYMNGVPDGSAPAWTVTINGTPDGG